MATTQPRGAKKAPPIAKKKNSYDLYIALFAVALLVFFLALYFLTRSHHKTEPKQNYQTLPQFVIDADGQAVRLQVIIQVSDNDSEWIDKNKQEIDLIFQKTVKEIDPGNFRSKAGLEAIQEKLKDAINVQMKVNKIEAVLYTDVIVQSKDEQ
jgi:flagellar basal body-associated protein FliL